MDKEKALLRENAKKKRLEIWNRGEDFREEVAEKIKKTFFDTFFLQPKSKVASFWSIGTEVKTQPILDKLLEKGHICLLPTVRGPEKPLVFRIWTRETEMVIQNFFNSVSIYGPPKKNLVCEPDLILVPLLAFDIHGTRLGYGKGYYDKYIESFRKKKKLIIGLAFAEQEVPFIPVSTHDVPLDFVITEMGCQELG
ncbi:MAG: 5-formyltetrahydrofolate cyclo-ligase [Alphaproteobacteria bacterium]|nr:5-formyltetrahydrofolate cyclo-ligase [Alphaproteobacteria bacterium]MBT5390134.1 5-formyltetrahydrofolate cyclo-ligase [Alphaproteobacteria bacterium]MBT5540138.1 5-formyltetrahydrofolate cyclo-ligase [Alphaproteobacteria bacterium]MBT5655032.1 5-formyltetrahydrofolate cyclo-ligase [Alphaproteobacteria bacterium]